MTNTTLKNKTNGQTRKITQLQRGTLMDMDGKTVVFKMGFRDVVRSLKSQGFEEVKQ